MAKRTRTIKEQIKRLEVIQDLIEHVEERIEARESWADRQLEQAKNEDGEIDESGYEYRCYLDYMDDIEASKKVLEELQDLA